MKHVLSGRSTVLHRAGFGNSSVSVTVTPSEMTYTGNPCTPPVMLTVDGVVLRPNIDYTVRYVNNVSAGSPTVLIEGKGSYYGSLETKFTIVPVSPVPESTFADATVTISAASFVYTGSPITPTPVVVLGGTTLTSGTHYTVSYSDNTEIGTATITITGAGIYESYGSVIKQFSIIEPSMDAATITLNSYIFTYTGALVCPIPTVTIVVGGVLRTLIKDVDYTVSYENNGKKGTAYTVVSGIGMYSGTKRIAFQIGKDLSIATVDICTNTYPYTGGEVRPEPIVTIANSRLIKGIDYTVSYTDNTSIGAGRIIVTGKGDYIGAASQNIWISDEENDAWDRCRFALSSSTSPTLLKFLPAMPDYQWRPYNTIAYNRKVYAAEFLPNGNLLLYFCWPYYKSASPSINAPGIYGVSPVVAAFKFEDGHKFDFECDDEGYLKYLNTTPVSVSRIREYSSPQTSPRYMKNYTGTAPYFLHTFDYGRQMIVPLSAYNLMQSGDLWTYNSALYPCGSETSETASNTPRNAIRIVDFTTPYDLAEYGSERTGYSFSFSDVACGTTYFTSPTVSANGKYVFAVVAYDGHRYPHWIYRFTLTEPWVISGEGSVEGSPQALDVRGINGLGNAGSTVSNVRFSPDGKNLYCVVDFNDARKCRFVKCKLGVPWDLTTISYDSTSNTLEDPNGTKRCIDDTNEVLYVPTKGCVLTFGKKPTDTSDSTRFDYIEFYKYPFAGASS